VGEGCFGYGRRDWLSKLQVGDNWPRASSRIAKALARMALKHFAMLNEEHNIDADAHIESVMPPTSSDSPTVEAHLVDGSPGWHTATSGIANLSLTDVQPALLIDGEPFTEEMGRDLISQYMSTDHPAKTFMISHPDQDYLEAVREIIETGRPGEKYNAFREKLSSEKDVKHRDTHAINDSVIDIPARDGRAGFHEDHQNLSRALYATQAHTHGLPYMSADQRDKRGISKVHEAYAAGDSQLPISTSHPELGEILQRVADLNSLDPFNDWLAQNPELSDDQKNSLGWLAQTSARSTEVQTDGLPPHLGTRHAEASR